MNSKLIVEKTRDTKSAVPAFNIPYLPMMAPVISALKDTNSFGFITVARLEWKKFESKSLQAVCEEYNKHKLARHTRLHLDHIPVIDEDGLQVDYLKIIQDAIDLGYESVMIDGSRLPLEENIRCTRQVVEMSHALNIPVEAELGAVMGHEEGPLPSYEELFASGKGFTDPAEAKLFVKETEVDWLSVAIGNIHGAISTATKDKEKISARLNIERLRCIADQTRVPLVLHGGTGICKEDIMQAVKSGIAKINVATAIRQPYERALPDGITTAQTAVYEATCNVIENDLELEGISRNFI